MLVGHASLAINVSAEPHRLPDAPLITVWGGV